MRRCAVRMTFVTGVLAVLTICPLGRACFAADDGASAVSAQEVVAAIDRLTREVSRLADEISRARGTFPGSSPAPSNPRKGTVTFRDGKERRFIAIAGSRVAKYMTIKLEHIHDPLLRPMLFIPVHDSLVFSTRELRIDSLAQVDFGKTERNEMEITARTRKGHTEAFQIPVHWKDTCREDDVYFMWAEGVVERLDPAQLSKATIRFDK